ncbi:Uncharacterized protein conserved in bacteria [Sphingobacterium spiritivorum]|uniref:Uncharacterized protein conserved in bacteria n=2 Tax=Sphingobacterium spiritivorum TaxID=258 RepID=A0A380B9D2_SPHSI|nr:Uncharacterized protein conserved in bacteria [Sphingobacterium spiritivorum]
MGDSKNMLHFRKIIILILFISHFPYQAISQNSPKRELRGVWIATVANIDWPSRDNESSERQKQELINILDAHQRAGLNAIFFQIRPAADAFYAKGREPWSRYLSGVQGKAPSPFYDPLEFVIEEAHKRGMELHAWVNPYRASTTLNPAHFSKDHITRTKPEWFFKYGGKYLFNPGLPEVRQYIIDVIMDVVKNYDVDGIHFDDYFYPYPDARNTALPDAPTFHQFGQGFANIHDWRRNNVDLLIRDLGIAIKKEKPFIKYGISPFGIWDNKRDNPDGSNTSGLSGYRTLYADGVKWMKEGWIDYINPQIYFPFNNRAAAFEILLEWWEKHTYGRHFYVGHGAYRVTEKRPGWTDKGQIPKQVRHLRDQHEVQGSIYFSSKSLMDNLAGLRDSMQYDLYRYKALPPTMAWIDSIPPQSPYGLQAHVSSNRKSATLVWQKPNDEQIYGYIIYRFEKGENINIANAERILQISYDDSYLQYTDNTIKPGGHYFYVVTAIDRMKNESNISNIREVILP